MSTNRAFRISIFAAGVAAFPAAASIVGVTPNAVQISPPTTVLTGTYYTSMVDYTTVWDEQQGVLASGVAADMVNNPASESTAIAGSVSGLVDSHYIYFRHWSQMSAGTVQFSGKIVGMAYSSATLDATDAQFAPIGTTYSPSYTWGRRGCVPGADLFSINNDTLTFNLFGDSPADTAEIRVFTEHVPAPGTAAAAALAGLAAMRRRRS